MPLADQLPIVAFYVGLNGLILVWLGLHVGKVRTKLGVRVGDGGKPALIRAMRGQANFAEYVPFALLILLAAAAVGTPGPLLHVFGVLLTLGRILHALHFTRDKAPSWMRGAGAGLTMLVLIAGSAGLIVQALWEGL